MMPNKVIMPLMAVTGLLLWAAPSRSELYKFVERGPLSQAQIDRVVAAGFPATYEQVVAILGTPEWRSQAQDLYQMPDGRWLAVSYDGRTAVGARVQVFPLEPDPVPANRWGSGLLSWEQFRILQHLAWPQSGLDMQGTFGGPAHRAAGADYYRLPNGRFAVIWYDAANQALGYAVQDAQ